MTNVSNTSDPEEYHSIPYPIPSIFMGILTAVGNSFVIAAVLKYSRLQTATNVFVCSLAAADMLVGCTNLAFSLCYAIVGYNQTSASNVGLVAALLSSFFNYVFIPLSVTSLLAVSLERYMAILYPFWYCNNVNRHRCIITAVIIWICSSVFALPILLIFFKSAQEQHSFFQQMTSIYAWLIGTLCVLVLVLMSGIYSRLWKISRRHSSKIADQDHGNNTRKETKKAKVIFIVVGCYFISFVPILCLSGYMLIQQSSQAFFVTDPPKWLFTCISISIIFLNSNSMVNPILYAWFNTDFREAFKDMVSYLRKNNAVAY